MQKTPVETSNLKALEKFLSPTRLFGTPPPPPTVEERIKFVMGYKGKNNSGLTSGSISKEVLAALTRDLTESQKNDLVAKLVKIEWDRARDSGDLNTFMRSNSLAKTALMSSFAVNEDQFKAFLENPAEYVRQFKVPEHLNAIAREIAEVNPSIILFSMMLGPVLQFQNLRLQEAQNNLSVAQKAQKNGVEVAPEEIQRLQKEVDDLSEPYKEAALASTKLTTVYRLLSSNRTTDNISEVEMGSYATALGTLIKAIQAPRSVAELANRVQEDRIQQKTPDWEERLGWVTGENEKIFSGGSSSVKVLDLLLEGLEQPDRDKLIQALVQKEWDRAVKSGDKNSFMRESSLSKTALMNHFRVAIMDNPQLAIDFKNDPIKFLNNVGIPDHLKGVFKQILDDKIKNGEPIYEFAHNIVFGMINGPVLNHFNSILLLAREEKDPAIIKIAEQNYQDVLKAGFQLTDSNRVLSQKTEEGKVSDKGREALDKMAKKGLETETLISYSDQLDSLMHSISDSYQRSTIAMEVLPTVSEYDKMYQEHLKNRAVVPYSGPKNESKPEVTNTEDEQKALIQTEPTVSTVSTPPVPPLEKKEKSFIDAVKELLNAAKNTIMNLIDRLRGNKDKGSSTESKLTSDSTTSKPTTTEPTTDKSNKDTSFKKTMVALLTGGKKGVMAVTLKQTMALQKEMAEVLKQRNQKQEQKDDEKQDHTTEKKESQTPTDGRDKVGQGWVTKHDDKKDKGVRPETVSQESNQEEPPSLH